MLENPYSNFNAALANSTHLVFEKISGSAAAGMKLELRARLWWEEHSEPPRAGAWEVRTLTGCSQ